jgi:hypothetical protein
MGLENNSETTPSSRILNKSTPTSQNAKNQKSILGFFQVKSSPSTPSGARGNASAEPISSPAHRASESQSRSRAGPTSRGVALNSTRTARNKNVGVGQNLSPAPSSDVVEPDADELKSEPPAAEEKKGSSEIADASLPSPAMSANGLVEEQTGSGVEQHSVNLSRRVCFSSPSLWH